MPHHLADGFYRHAVVQANQGRKRVAAHIVGKVASQITLFGYHLQVTAQARSLRNEEQFPVLSLATVLLDDAQGYVQQLDVALRFRLLTGDVNPLAAVLLRDDVVLRQIR